MNLMIRGTTIACWLLFAGVASGQSLSRPDRTDLARVYLEYEAALQASPLERDERIRLAGQQFDLATVQFFRGDSAEALRMLNDLNARLWGDVIDLRIALGSIRAEIDPVVLHRDEEGIVRFTLSSMHTMPKSVAENGVLDVRITLTGTNGEVVAELYAPLDVIEGTVRKEFRWSLPDDLQPGDHVVQLRIQGTASRRVGRISVVEDCLEEFTERKLGRISEIGQGQVQDESIRVVRSWIDLIDPRSTRYATTRFVYGPHEVRGWIDAWLSASENGRDSVVGQSGDVWGVLDTPAGEVPFRLYVPRNLSKDEPAPLVMVLHGAGGDEHMFFEGCGNGLIKELAERHGFIVVSPSTYSILGDPAAFDRVVGVIGSWHDIDPKRVLVVGHSLGGITASGLAQLRHDRIAGVVGIAGTRPFVSTMECAPVLIIGAGRDLIVPARRLAQTAARAAGDGLPVRYEEYPDLGHTVVVNETLEYAIGWLFKGYGDDAPVEETQTTE